MKNSASLFLVCLSVVGAAAGCAVVLPAHTHSNARNGEQVDLQMLDLKAIQSYRSQYELAFGNGSLPTEGAVEPRVAPAALASIAIAFAVDYVKTQLQEEATLYEAQYTGHLSNDKFWNAKPTTITMRREKVTTTTRKEKRAAEEEFKLAGPITQVTEEEYTTQTTFGARDVRYLQRYFGFKLARTVKKCGFLNQDGESGNCRQTASDIVFGIAPSADQQMFRVAPISFQTQYARAKVVSDEWHTWPRVWTWIGKLIRIPGHTIDVDMAVEIDAYWRSKDQQLNVVKVAALKTSVAGYDISNSPILIPGKGLSPDDGGWLLGVPVSYGPYGEPVVGKQNDSGTFTLKVLVTERDTSNTKRILEQAADFVGKQGKDLPSQFMKQ